MGITVSTSPQNISASVGETKIDVSVSGGIGPTGPSGEAGGGYVLPVATGSVLGGVKAGGSGISIDGDGVISATVSSLAWADITGKPSDFTPSSHSHGNITNDGKVGTAADKVLVTTSAGAVTATSSITFSQVASTSTYTNFNTSPGDLATALSGIDSALGDRALASDFDQGVKTTDSPQFDGLTLSSLTMYGGDVSFGASGGTFVIAGFGVYIDIEQRTIGTNGIVGWYFQGDMDFTYATITGIDASDVGASALGHAHSAADVTSGTFDIARIPTGTTSTTVSLGNHTHAVTALTAGTWKTFYSNGTAVVELAIGATGKVLTSNGTAAAPTWETPTTYTLPASTTSALGGVIVPISGGLTVDGGGNISASLATTAQANVGYSASTALMTPALSRAARLSVLDWGIFSTSSSGGGSVTAGGLGFGVLSSATAGGTASQFTNAGGGGFGNPWTGGGATINRWPWNKRAIFAARIARYAGGSANAVFQIGISESSSGYSAAHYSPVMLCEVRNNRYWLVVRNATTTTSVDSGVDYSSGTADIVLEQDGSGNVTLSVDGTQIASSSAGATASTTALYARGSVTNGGDATASSWLFSAFRVSFA